MQQWFAISLLIIIGILILVAFCQSGENFTGCPSGSISADGALYTVTVDGRTLSYGSDQDRAIARWKYDYPNCTVPSAWSLPAEEEEEDDIVEATVSPSPQIKGLVICFLTEYDQPPDDSQGPPSQDELNQITEAEQLMLGEEEENEYFDEDEYFRIVRGGGGGRRGGGGGRRGGGRRGGLRGGGLRGGRRLRRRGGRMFWPWRRWPRRYYRRPWRSYLWQSYPSYVYTYPLSYYDDYWEAPIQRFTVRIGPKGDQHPWAGEGSNLGYMITSGTGTGCGTSGARLDLVYGRTYEFDIYTSQDCVTQQPRSQPFFFTTDPKGGSRSGEIFNINPTVNGTIRITITDNLPQEFYYQSTNSQQVGGYVFLRR